MKNESILRILLIDDQAGFGHLLTQILADTPTDFKSCVDPHAGLREAMVFQPDLILLDVDMPDLNGIEILEQLKRMSATKNIPVMMFTAHTDTATVSHVLKHGAADYLVKPFESITLAEKINNLLDREIFNAEALKMLKEGPQEDAFQANNVSGAELLLVDDDPVMGRVIQDLTQEFGLSYAWAGSTKQAWKLMEDGYPRLVLLDIGMPNENGLQMLADLRHKKETCCIPVLMLTASTQLNDVQRARDLGAQGYMLKPFSVQNLMDKIQSILNP